MRQKTAEFPLKKGGNSASFIVKKSTKIFRHGKYATPSGTILLKNGAEGLGALFHVIGKIIQNRKIEDNTDKAWRHFPLPKGQFVWDMQKNY